MLKTLLILILSSLFAIASPINLGPRNIELFARGQAATQLTGPRQSSSSQGTIGRDRGNAWNVSPVFRSRPAQSAWSPAFVSLPAPREGPPVSQKLSSLRGAGQTVPIKQSSNPGRNSSPARIASARASPFPSNTEAEKLLEAVREANSKLQFKARPASPAKDSSSIVAKVFPKVTQLESCASSSFKAPDKTPSTLEPPAVPAITPSAMPGAKLGSNNQLAALDEADSKPMTSVPGPTLATGGNNPIAKAEVVPKGGGTPARGEKI